MAKIKAPNFGYLKGFVFGAFLTIECALLIGWFLTENGEKLYRIMTDWSGFSGAIFAALIALYSVQFGINYQRRRELSGARAVLPLALTRLMDIGRHGLRLSVNEGGIQGQLSLEEQRATLMLDSETLEILKENTSWAEPNAEAWLTVLIARYQVYVARVESWIDQAEPQIGASGQLQIPYPRQDALLDWATFIALTEHLFAYARGSVADAPKNLDVSRIQSAFFLNLDGANHRFDDAFQNRIDVRCNRLRPGAVEQFQFNGQ